jgi:hypothetical protein
MNFMCCPRTVYYTVTASGGQHDQVLHVHSCLRGAVSECMCSYLLTPAVTLWSHNTKGPSGSLDVVTSQMPKLSSSS